jgi:4-amino-4-deoxy-L-arabinose transferase-like glycosyltransferase
VTELPFFTGEQGRGRILALLFFLSISVVAVWGTWQGTLPASNEALYAETAREIVTTGNAVTMHLDGAPVHDTPPLGPWLMALFYRLFGVGDFAARFAFVVLSVLVAFIVYHAGRTASRAWDSYPDGCADPSGDEACRRLHWGSLPTAVGLLSAVVLAATPLFGRFSPHITLGLPYAFAVSVALLGWLTLPSRRLGLVLWGAGVAGCAVSGGAGAIFVVAGALLAGLDDGERRPLWRSGPFWLATLVGAALGGLWLVPETVRSGEGLLSNALWAPVAAIVRPPVSSAALTLHAFRELWLRALPWSIPATIAFAKIVFYPARRRRDGLVEDVDGALFIFATVVFAPIALGGARHLDALLPVLPFGAIISAREVVRWLERPGRDLSKRVWTFNHVMIALFLLLMLFVAAAPISIRRIVNDPIKDVARMASRLTVEGTSIGNFGQPQRVQGALMLFYGNRSLEAPRASAEDVARALREHPRMIFLSSARDLEKLRASGAVPSGVQVLYGAGDLVLFGARASDAPEAP